MKIINAMFGQKLGGIEQAFVDYANVLKKEGHSVLNLVHPDAKIIDSLWEVSSRIQKVKNRGQWDFMASLKLKKTLSAFNPDIIICHGNRAFSLLNRARDKNTPIVGLTHNYKFRKLLKCDALFTITKDLQEGVIKAGFPFKRTYLVPNMIRLDLFSDIHFRFKPFEGRMPVIGTMGRFVKKKGFDQMLIALAELKNKKINFHAVIGGEGEEKENLLALRKKLGLEKEVEFPGWIKDKKEFYDSIDIFVLPSLHEPFGIVLLEAFTYCKPIVSANSEGPREIIQHEENGLLYEATSPESLADALERVIMTPRLAEWIAGGGYKTVLNEYDSSVVGKKISSALEEIAMIGK